VGGEFLVAGGDATEGFEAGEEVFDTMALEVEVLVKGRFFALLFLTAMTAMPPSWFT